MAARKYPKLETQVADFVATNDKRMLALMRLSLQDVVNDALTPVGKGGRMRVDTGFLRASGQPSLSGMPTGPARGSPTGKYEPDSGVLSLTLAKMELGQTFYFGWTANYAKYREAYDGFLEGALQKWSKFVEKNTEEIRKRITKP